MSELHLIFLHSLHFPLHVDSIFPLSGSLLLSVCPSTPHQLLSPEHEAGADTLSRWYLSHRYTAELVCFCFIPGSPCPFSFPLHFSLLVLNHLLDFNLAVSQIHVRQTEYTVCLDPCMKGNFILTFLLYTASVTMATSALKLTSSGAGSLKNCTRNVTILLQLE